MNENTAKRAELISAILDRHFEPGRHDKCKTQIWRNVIKKIHPMSRRTFFRYLERAKKNATDRERISRP